MKKTNTLLLTVHWLFLASVSGCDSGNTSDHGEYDSATSISKESDTGSQTTDSLNPEGEDSATNAIEMGIWSDESSGLVWQNPPIDNTGQTLSLAWEEAMAYCDSLVLDNADDWRLPTVNEYQTFIRGCPDAEPGNDDCLISDPDCLAMECLAFCGNCAELEGPDPVGCYWPTGILGDCGAYWTSSAEVPVNWAYTFQAHKGRLFADPAAVRNNVRCVRGSL